MVEKLCKFYGEHVSIEGDDFYDFPTIEALSQEGVEKKLRESGKFHYKAHTHTHNNY